MKKFKIFAVASITVTMAVVIGIFGVNAEGFIANEEELLACVSPETTDTETETTVSCKLGESFTVTNPVEIADNVNVTLDLNGKSITASSDFTSSMISYGMFIVHNGGTLTVNDATGEGKISVGETSLYGGIVMTKTGDNSSKTATLVVNGGTIEGYYYAIVGNGSRPNTSITINNGTFKALNREVGLGIFHPQIGTLTVNNGTIYGTTGIEMRSGELNVTGGTIVGDKDSLTVKASGSGSTTIGAGIAIAQHNTANDLSVNVSGGTIQGYSALYESNPQGNTEEELAKVTLAVTGGTFETINGGTTAVYSENKTGFITGGKYSTDVRSYVQAGHTTKLIGDMYTVGTEYNINVTEVSNGTVEVDKTKALTGETVTVTITPDEEYEVVSVKVLDAENNIIEVTNNTFTMPTSDVTVTVELSQIKYTVNTNGLTNGEFTVDKTEAAKGETVTVTVTPDAEYELDKIIVIDENDTELTVTDGKFTMPSGEVTVSVQLKQIEYVVNVSDFTNGTVAIDKTVAVKGDTVTITATPEEGYEVSSVKVVDMNEKEVSVSSGQFTMPGSGVTVTVEFAKIKYAVTASELENGTVSVDKTTATFGEEVTVTVTPDAGYELNGIIVLDENGTEVAVTDGKFTMPTSNVTVSATFADIRHTVKTSALAHGTITVDKPEADRGDTVTITVTPDAEYKLVSIKVVDVDGTEVEVIDGKFEMPNSEVTVSVELTQIKYAVNITEPTNGTVEVDKTEAAKGETVTITAIIPEDGYELSSVKVVDKDNKEITLTNDTFTMPSGEVTVSVELTEISYTTEVKPVDPTEEVEEVEVGVKESEELNDVLLDSLTEMLDSEDEEMQELASIVGTTSTKVEVEISKLNEDTIEEEVVEAMQETAGTAKIATFFDINILIKTAKENEVLGSITELTKEIELMILLPEELKNNDKDINRTYYVVRKHGTRVDKLPATLSEDGNSLVFKSKDFSTYALAYEDKTNTPNPDTYDGISVYVILGSLSLISLVGITILTKKKKLFN